MIKKVFSIIAAIAITATFTACDKKSESKPDTKAQNSSVVSQTSQTATVSEANVGDVLEKPEIEFSNESGKLYLRFTVKTEDTEGEEMEVAFDQITDDTYLMYVTNGLLKVDEIVYEVGDDKIEKYTRSILEENFRLDTSTSQDDLQDEIDYVMELSNLILSPLTGDGIEYHKLNDREFMKFGKVYVYEMYQSGEKQADVWVDAKSGLITSFRTVDGNTSITLSEYTLDGYDIPQYK